MKYFYLLICIVLIVILFLFVFKHYSFKKFLPNIHFKENQINQNDSKNIKNASTPVGKWDFSQGDTYPGSINIQSDNTFVFSGWKDPSFISRGLWSYDNKKEIITLTFKDNVNYWDSIFLSKKNEKNDAYTINNNEKFSSINLFIKSNYSDNVNCKRSISFFGWSFCHTKNT